MIEGESEHSVYPVIVSPVAFGTNGTSICFASTPTPDVCRCTKDLAAGARPVQESSIGEET